MEKRRPTDDLDAIQQALGSAETLSITTSALRDALELGFDRHAVAGVVGSMDRGMFYKSMTTLADHRIWQDVSHVPSGALTLYVKVRATVVTQFTPISFKER